MPTVRIDDEVFEALKKLAEPLVDTPNSVLRRLLDLETKKPAPKKDRGQAPISGPRDKTPQSVYEENLLAVLAAPPFNGRGNKKDVTLAVVERMMKRGLIPASDMEFVATGETKAENKISWGRNVLKNRSLIRDDSPRGVWEIDPESKVRR
jgi:hypothetical protein